MLELLDKGFRGTGYSQSHSTTPQITSLVLKGKRHFTMERDSIQPHEVIPIKGQTNAM